MPGISDYFGQGSRTGNFGIGSGLGARGMTSGNAAFSSVARGVAPATGASSGVARPGNCPDYDMFAFGATGALAVQTLITVIAGVPPSYTYATTYVTFERGRGRPWVGPGCVTSLTKPGPGQLTGNISYGADPAASYPAFVNDPLDALTHATAGTWLPMSEGEVVGPMMDNNNTNEQVQGMGMVCYGKPGHRWPEDVEELLKVSGLSGKIREIWMPRIGLTASLTVQTPTVVMNAAGCTDDRWIDGESSYYVLGAMTQSVAAASGVLNFSQGLPDYLKVRNNCIPYGNSFYAASGSGKGKVVPAYWPIGPFTAANPIQIGATGTAAAAQVVRVVIGKV